MMKVFSGLAILATILLASCSTDKEEFIPCSYDRDSLIYNGLVKAIINSSCAASASCHALGGVGEGDFNTYNGLIEKKDKLKGRINGTAAGGPMPPAGSISLTECEKQILLDWIDDDTPEN